MPPGESSPSRLGRRALDVPQTDGADGIVEEPLLGGFSEWLDVTLDGVEDGPVARLQEVVATAEALHQGWGQNPAMERAAYRSGLRVIG